jgi:hypothetical protein
MGVVAFGRVRRWGIVVATSLVSAVVIVLCGPVRYSINPNDGYLVAVVAQIPVITAIAFQAASISPLRTAERRAARPLRRFRGASYVLLSVVTAAMLASAASLLGKSAVTDGFGAFAVVRNLCALIGASFVGASLLGRSLGWCLPLAWTVLPYVLLTQESSKHEVLALVTQPDSSYAATLAAGLLWGVGLVVVSGSREDVLEIVPAIRRIAQKRSARSVLPTR